MGQPLVKKLLDRGDQLEIRNGGLCIKAKSGKPIPESWLKNHERNLVIEILQALKMDALLFTDFSTGMFSNGSYPGVQMQFEYLRSEKTAFCVFNAHVTYCRGVKKGSILPRRQFRVGKKSEFYKFWRRSTLHFPKRLSAFHDYIGNLKKLYLCAREQKGEKLEKQTLQPLSISAKQIKDAFTKKEPENLNTESRQIPNKIHTRLPNNDLDLTQPNSAFAADSTKGRNKCGIGLTGSEAISKNGISFHSHQKPPEEQTVEEWLADYDEA